MNFIKLGRKTFSKYSTLRKRIKDHSFRLNTSKEVNLPQTFYKTFKLEEILINCVSGICLKHDLNVIGNNPQSSSCCQARTQLFFTKDFSFHSQNIKYLCLTCLASLTLFNSLKKSVIFVTLRSNPQPPYFPESVIKNQFIFFQY